MTCKRRTCLTRPEPAGLLLLVLSLSPLGAVQMVRIANVPPTLDWTSFPCGDARHSGYNAAYGISRETLFAVEYQGNGSFQSRKLRYLPYTSAEFGDGDNDGLMEIVSEQGGGNACIYESRAPDSFPGDSIWGATPVHVASVSTPKYVDLDRDGRQELALAVEGHGIWLYENTSDNEYESAAVLTCGVMGDFCTGDFDRDGLMEVVAGSQRQSIFIFEALGPDNEYARSATLQSETIENYNHGATHDMDLDGWPEFIVIGRGLGGAWVMVYEATGHAQYALVWHDVRTDFNWFADHPVSVGDVDGDSTEEFIVATGNGAVVLYKATGQHTWQQVWYYDQAYSAARLFDINRDGRAEVILDGPDGVEIWEDTQGLCTTERPPTPAVRSIAVEPTVSRRGWPAIFTGLPDAATVEVHDLAGRLVRTQLLKAGPSWTWDLRDQAGNLVSAGTYFAVVRSKERLASLKLCVVK